MERSVDVICDPNRRMRITMNMAVIQEVSPTIPINRFAFQVFHFKQLETHKLYLERCQGTF